MCFDVLLLLGPDAVESGKLLKSGKDSLDAVPFGAVEPPFDLVVDVGVLGIAEVNAVVVQRRLGQSLVDVVDGFDRTVLVVREDLGNLLFDGFQPRRFPRIDRVQEPTAEAVITCLPVVRAVVGGISKHRLRKHQRRIAPHTPRSTGRATASPTASRLHSDEDRLFDGHVNHDEHLMAVEAAFLLAPAGSFDVTFVDLLAGVRPGVDVGGIDDRIPAGLLGAGEHFPIHRLEPLAGLIWADAVLGAPNGGAAGDHRRIGVAEGLVQAVGVSHASFDRPEGIGVELA